MAPFFSYRTFASVKAAVGEAAGTTAGEGVSAAVAEAMFGISCLGNKRASRRRRATGNGRWLALGSHEGAEAGDGLADDQVLHLIRAFVGVERLGIVEEARDVVIGDDAVAPEDLTAPGYRLARFRRAECFREGRVVI